MSQVKVEKLAKIYGTESSVIIKALDEVSFEINEGEFVVVLGSSGAGKSTLLNILGGMDSATSGKYIIGDKDITSYNEKELSLFRRLDIGFVFQFYNLMPNLTALENVELAESVCPNSMNSLDALEKVGLGKRIHNFPAQLSGGEQQRVAIARAIVKKPLLLLCDEPTGALDSKTGAQIIDLLYNICKDEHKTIIIVTHNSAIGVIADRLIRIADGKVVENSINSNPCKVEDITW